MTELERLELQMRRLVVPPSRPDADENGDSRNFNEFWSKHFPTFLWQLTEYNNKASR